MPRAYTLADVIQQLQLDHAQSFDVGLELPNMLVDEDETQHITDAGVVTPLNAATTSQWGNGKWNEFLWT